MGSLLLPVISMSTIVYALEAVMILVLIVFVLLLSFRPKPARIPSKSSSGVLNTDHDLYEPFKRHDQYGDLGAKPQPMLEYLRLAVLTVFLTPLRFYGAFMCVLSVHIMCRCGLLSLNLSILLIRPVCLSMLPQTWEFILKD